ncbi:MAG TPA: hypothetical protein VMV96_04740 [Acidimicrobiales bacterium]|nr:hypothetical protein [Acidimicrobiales bacterium]
MSVIAFPRPIDTRRVRPKLDPTAHQPSHRAGAPRRRAVLSIWRGASSTRRAAFVVLFALTISLVGSMIVANRQIQLHALQSQLLQEQSTYAVQVGSLTDMSAPSQIATRAGALHLVDPVSVTQVPSTSLDAPLPLPKFLGYAPVTSRTIR